MATSKASKLNVEVDATSAIGSINKLNAAFARLQSRIQKTASSFAKLGTIGSSAFSRLGRAGASAFRVLSKGFSIVARLARTFVNVFKTVLKVVLAAGAGFALFAKSVTETGNQINKFINTLVILKGNVKDAKTELGFLFDMSNKLGTSFTAAATPFTKFAAAAAGTISDQSIRDVFESFATVGVALQLTKSEVTGVFLALQQIASKGVVSMEELRLQLAERVPGAMRLAASSMGMTMADFEEAVRDRTINAGEFLEKFSAKLKATFGIAADLASKRLFADIQRLGNALTAFKLNVFVAGFETGLRNLVSSATSFLNNNPELAQALGEFSEGIFNRVASFLDSLSADKVISALNTLIGAFETLINVMLDLARVFQRAFGGETALGPIMSDIKTTSLLINKLIGERNQLDADIKSGVVDTSTATGRFFGVESSRPQTTEDFNERQSEFLAVTESIRLLRVELDNSRAKAIELGAALGDLPEDPLAILRRGTLGSSDPITLPRIEAIPAGAPGTGGQLNLSGQPLGVDATPPAVFSAQEDADVLLNTKMPVFFDAIISGDIRNGMDDLARITHDLNVLLDAQSLALEDIVTRSAEINRLRSLPEAELAAIGAEKLNNLIREQSSATELFIEAEEKKFELMKDQNDELDRRQAILDKIDSFQKSLEETFTSVQDVIFNSIKKTEDAIVQLVTTGKASFSDLANAIIADLTRMAIQAFFTRFILGPLLQGPTQALGDRLGGTFATQNGISSNPFGSGPMVPEVHTGGIIGGDRLQQRNEFDKLRTNEQPIIVERGEGIFTQEQMRALAPISQISSRMSDRTTPSPNVNPVINIKPAGTKVEIINQTDGTATVESETGADGTELIRVVINAVAADIGGDGQISKVMKGKFGLRNTTGLR